MATTTYYPSSYGAAEFLAPGTGSDAGTATFQANYQDTTPNSYIVVTTVDGTDPKEYEITSGYTGPGTGSQYVAYQTSYSNTNYNETYAPNVPIGGGATQPAYLILSNTPVNDSTNYMFNGASSPFVPTQDTTSDPTACFVSGTLIRTMHGDISVEALQIGDIVVNVSSEQRPIKWIGHRTIDCGNHPRPHEVMPIRIAAHAFGENRPARDLFLSPGHPVFVGADVDCAGGYLVPIMCLINGITIERVAVDEVTYWHVELDEHDILLAEGLPAESYIDLGSRPWFDGANGALYDPDIALPGMPGRCRPVAIDGPVVEAERQRLDAVFAARLTAASAWPSAEVALPF